MVALPVFLLPIGMREGTPADILVGRAYAAANPVDPEEVTVLIEDWAINVEGKDADPSAETIDSGSATGEVSDENELDAGLIILTEGETVGQTYIDGAVPEEPIENTYEGILTATVVQTYDSSDLPIELLDTQTFLSDSTTFYIKAAGSIIKEKPNMDSGTVSKISLGTEVIRIGIGDTWSKIRTEEGTEGYVPSDTITEEMVFVAIDRTVWVDASGLKLRSEPSTESAIIKTLSRYTKLRCSGVSDKWFEVTTEDGDEGFVYISYTTQKAPPTPTPKPTPKKAATTKTGKTGNTSTLPTITGVNGESVISVCKSMLGVEYKWNGESRDGVDCSGLVVYAYRQVGVGGLPHQSNSLKNYGVEVARSDIKLGDVVCYDIRGSSDSVEHVGIYAGGNQVIHASSTRDRVEYASLDMYPIVSIRRIIQ
jgi:cell wall-associated NlpC family hydrolase